MKTTTKRTIALAAVVVAAIAFAVHSFVSVKVTVGEPAQDTGYQSVESIFSGYIATGSELTGVEVATGYDKDETFATPISSYEWLEVTRVLPKQPKMPGNYSGNTAVLRKYIGANQVKFNLTAAIISTGHISFKLTKPLIKGAVTVKTNYTLSNWGVWGRLDMTKATISGSTYTFPLSDVAIKFGSKQVGGNFMPQLDKKELVIGAFVGENANNVESITINFR